jgi:hypothetical protein
MSEKNKNTKLCLAPSAKDAHKNSGPCCLVWPEEKREAFGAAQTGADLSQVNSK